MRLVPRISLTVMLLLSCAATSWAGTTPGAPFDGNFSLVFNPASGDVSIEVLPQLNPVASRLLIHSAGGLLIPSALTVPSVTAPPVSVIKNPSVFDIKRIGPAFLGNGWSLGPILPIAPAPTFATLQTDLTIEWWPASAAPSFTAPGIYGDLLYGTLGNTQSDPILPGAQVSGVWQFTAAQSGGFFDPPSAYGFEYEMTDGWLFTKVGLPVGKGNNFTITSSQPTVSGLTEGSLHSFSSGGVSSFTITGINPLVDENNSAAFPVYLEFNNSTASFNMTPLVVPEPGTLALAALALGCLCGRSSRRR